MATKKEQIFRKFVLLLLIHIVECCILQYSIWVKGYKYTLRCTLKIEYTVSQVPSLGYAVNTREHAGPVRQDPVRASDKHYGSERKIATSMCDDNPRGQWYFRPATDIAMGAATGEPCGGVTAHEESNAGSRLIDSRRIRGVENKYDRVL